ncbi:hypothetical protein CRYUN_Cryun39dG0080500 [Craigia yunnanensis]
MLQYLSLSNNHFQVPMSFMLFANHFDLKILFSNENKLVEQPVAYQTWFPKFQLNVFSLSNCTIEEHRKLQLPNFLYYQYDLRLVDLSYINFGGIKFPDWLVENNTRLEQLYMKDSSIVSPLFLPSHPNYNLGLIDISNNKMQHQIPTNICSLFPNLEKLLVSRNAFKSSIPLCLGGMRSLSLLDMSHNQLFGGIPEELAMSGSLRFLRLSNNTLSGKMFPAIYHSNMLQALYLDGNNFEGDLPQFSPISSSELQTLAIHDNHLSSKLPRCLWDKTYLQILDLSNNHLEGPIPVELCNMVYLNFLDLSHNNLCGTIPSCFNLQEIKYVYLRKNNLSGPLSPAFYGSSSLVTLDLSENNFIGNIPDWNSTLPALSVLLLKKQINSMQTVEKSYISTSNWELILWYEVLADTGLKIFDQRNVPFAYYLYPSHSFSYNNAEEEIVFSTKSASYNYTGYILGAIPSTFSKLKQIESLDLSYNNLNGSIPPQLTELYTLEVFTVAYNNLSGPLPDRKAQFGTFNERSYEGNPRLCGPPLNSCSEGDSPETPSASSGEDEEHGFIDMVDFYICFGVSYAIMFLGISIVLYINPYWRREWFYFIEKRSTACYFFIVGSLHRLTSVRDEYLEIAILVIRGCPDLFLFTMSSAFPCEMTKIYQGDDEEITLVDRNLMYGDLLSTLSLTNSLPNSLFNLFMNRFIKCWVSKTALFNSCFAQFALAHGSISFFHPNMWNQTCPPQHMNQSTHENVKANTEYDPNCYARTDSDENETERNDEDIWYSTYENNDNGEKPTFYDSRM